MVEILINNRCNGGIGLKVCDKAFRYVDVDYALYNASN